MDPEVQAAKPGKKQTLNEGPPSDTSEFSWASDHGQGPKKPTR